MARLQHTEGLTDEQTELLMLVRQFVDEQIIPVAMELERKDEYPTQIVEGMKETVSYTHLTLPTNREV